MAGRGVNWRRVGLRALLASSYIAIVIVVVAIVAMFTHDWGTTPLLRLGWRVNDAMFHVGRVWGIRPPTGRVPSVLGMGLVYTTVLALAAGAGIYYSFSKLRAR